MTLSLVGIAKAENIEDYFNGGVKLSIHNSKTDDMLRDKKLYVYYKGGKFSLCYEFDNVVYYITPESDSSSGTGREAFIKSLEKYVALNKKSQNRNMMSKLNVNMIVIDNGETTKDDQRMMMGLQDDLLIMVVTGYNYLTLCIDQDDIPELIKICKMPSK